MAEPIKRSDAEAVADQMVGERLRELLAIEAARDRLAQDYVRVMTERDNAVAELGRSEAACASALAEIEALKADRLLSVLFGHHEGAPKPFALQRRGGQRELVALGAEFPDGAVALRLANDGGWTTKSAGGAAQFVDATTEILWLSDELEPLAAMEAERDDLTRRLATVCEQRDTWRRMHHEVEAERDRQAPVVEAAKAWRVRTAGTILGDHERPLAATVDALEQSTTDGAPC